MKTKSNKLLGGLLFVTLTITPIVLMTLCSNLRAQGIAPPPGLVAWWPGDGNANDIVGTNNGTLMGNADFVPGEAGQAFSFDGASGCSVQVPDADSLNLRGSMTIEAWIKPSVPLSQQTIWAPIVTKFYSPLPRNGWLLFTSGTWSTSPGLLSFQITDNCPDASCVSGGGSWQGDLAPTNAFTHLAGVYDQSAGTMALYVNGLLTGQSSIGPYQIGRTTEPLLIGGNSAEGPSFNGVIDEVTLYSRALSSNEIASIYAAGSAGKCKDPLIIRHPQSQNLYWGQAATFNVGVKGTQPFSYQWLKNGQPITGETTTNLVLTSVQATNAGSYSVIVSNSVGAVTSYPANLSVSVAGVSLALYPGISIQGLVSQTYGIQYTSDLSNTNSWVGVTNMTLTTPTQIWYDSQPALLSSRFYRVVPGPIPIP
jgi:hypothetical protein